MTPKEAEKIVYEHYNIQGKAKRLAGEVDLNFRIIIKHGEGYVLKISRPDENEGYLDFQQRILEHIELNAKSLPIPKLVLNKKGDTLSKYTDEQGHSRHVRLITWIPGRLWSSINPQLIDLREDLGAYCGRLTKALQGFDHPEAHRDFEWDVAQSLWTKNHLHLFDKQQREIIRFFQKAFEVNLNDYRYLRKSVIHNDANDNNILVSEDLIKPKVRGIIDYGDAIFTQVINEMAVTCAYAIMLHNDPLEAAMPIIRGYHTAFPLEENELEHLYDAIAMRLVVSITKSALNRTKEPTNEYLFISEKAAWNVLKKWRNIESEFAHFSFRKACGFDAHPHLKKFKEFMLAHSFKYANLFLTAPNPDIHLLDLSVSSRWLGHKEEFNDPELFQFNIERLQKEHPNTIIAGGYLEPRSFYTSSDYGKIGNSGNENRTIHLGIDFWLPAKTPVYALLDGEVVVAMNNNGNKTYGGLIILRHTADNFEFYTLYGHLSAKSIVDKKIGQFIRKGSRIGQLGGYHENGHWVPHLHFQILLSLLNNTTDFPGVAFYAQIEIWKDLCPDPNLLFKSTALTYKRDVSTNKIISYRKKHLGRGLSLHYTHPLKIVRGDGQYLIDEHGRKFLDTVNNVAHVGHENFAVVNAGQKQMALLNTNTRYLHENINTLAQELLATLPSELSVVHFVNSGSEANELAIRMARTVTGEQDVIASEMGYHGNTSLCVDISSYKFDRKGGQGVPSHTHIFALPDTFRGTYRGPGSGSKYADDVQRQIKTIHQSGRRLAAFIIEPILSCGGQIEPPKGFLKLAYQYIKEAGGICISDEVQVGCGRLGKTFWGFELHDVLPDIITIGKPLGNGHPLAAVICTPEIADKFANGMEYFNTFGGNPVSCAIGLEVLRTVKRERLQDNALKVGEFLKTELKNLTKEFSIIGNVRGQGLFLGVELVDSKLNPLSKHAHYLIERMRSYGILMSTDGPDNNVLKIKPPLIFTETNAKELIYYLRKVLAEDFMLHF